MLLSEFLKKRFEIQDSIMDILDNYTGIPILVISSFYVCIKFYKFFIGEPNLHDLIFFGAVSVMFSIPLWLFLRNVSKFEDDEIGVLIALIKPETEERVNVNKELKMIFSSLSNLVKKEKISDTVKIRFIPKRLCPENEESAYKLRDKYNAALVVWGNVNYGNINNSKHTAFLPIFFSYALRLTAENTSKFSKNLTQILMRDKWIIREENNLFDRNYLVENLEKISLYIIGFVHYGKNIDIATHFLKRSLGAFDAKNLTDNVHSVARENIRMALLNIFDYKIAQLELWYTSKKIDTEISKAEEIITELAELGFTTMLHNLEAILYTATLKYGLAKDALGKIPPEVQKRDPAILFNWSYIYYAEGDVVRGTQFLLKSIRANLFNLSDQSPGLARWYEDELAKDSSRVYLNFPLGIIYCDLMRDKISAKNCLEKSLEYGFENKNINRVYAQIEYESEKRLKKL